MKSKFSKDSTLMIKGMAIILMYVHHYYTDKSRYASYIVDFFPFHETDVVRFAQFGKVCVGMFVFLSAYGITSSMKAKSPSYDFTRRQSGIHTLKRMTSLMGGYWFAFLVMFLISFAGFSWNYREVYGIGKMGVYYFVIDFLGLSHLYDTPTFCPTWWYMTLAILIVLLMPVLVRWYKKDGILMILLCLLIPRALNLEILSLTRWLLAVNLGILFADRDLLVKCKDFMAVKNLRLNKLIKFVTATVLLFVCIKLKISPMWRKYLDIWDSAVPVFIVYYGFEFITPIPGVSRLLKFIGRYSMNMFLTHTFFRALYFGKFFYSFHYAFLNVLVLLVITLALSVLMEWVKKVLRYEKIFRKIYDMET